MLILVAVFIILICWSALGNTHMQTVHLRDKSMTSPSWTYSVRQQSDYQAPRQKLSQIRQIRRHSLNTNNTRIMQIEDIRDKKHIDFVNKFNEKQETIITGNLQLFRKIKTVKPAVPRHSATLRRLDSANSSYQSLHVNLSRLKENQRLKNKINSSIVNIDSISPHQITSSCSKGKGRGSNSKIGLANTLSDSSKSCSIRSLPQQTTSSRTLTTSSKGWRRSQQSPSEQQPIMRSARPKIASFYNMKQIRSNRIEAYAPKMKQNCSIKHNCPTSQMSYMGNSRRSAGISFFPTSYGLQQEQ